MTTVVQTRTAVGIVGAGPAGLMLAHLLRRNGIDSVAVDTRTRPEIETTHRAGILERDSVRLLVDSGVSDRVLREGREHTGIDLRYDGHSHRVDFQELVGASTWLYPQTEVFVDLADAADRDHGDVRFGVTETNVSQLLHRPRLEFVDADGTNQVLDCDFLVGADGSRGICRRQVPADARTQYFREYPFAWFGILCKAPISAPELIYARSDRGFALVSQRTDEVQRMYLQWDPAVDPGTWSDDQIWDEFHLRLAGSDGFELQTGPITERTVLPFRSFVQEPMRYGNLLLAGDAAHTVPPTGAKGLNLALADVVVLAEHLTAAVRQADPEPLDGYTPRALSRVWKAQHFSFWMTTMLHTPAGSEPFDLKRQLGELDTLTSSPAGARYLAEGYTGWPTT